MDDRRTGAGFMVGLALSAAVLLADQVSKWWILEVVRLHEKGHVEVSGVFDLTFVTNFGVSFGLLRAGSGLERGALIVMSLGIASVFGWWMRTAERRLTMAALALVVGGAIGNLIDRLRFGYVVDFLDFSGLYFPWVFNVADSAITVGAALLVLDYLTTNEARSEGKPRRETQ